MCCAIGRWVDVDWGFLRVVLAGSPHDPISKSLALDMERRGFIVFVVVNSIEDEQLVVGEGRGDIRPLNIDILDVSKIVYTLVLPPS